ncbi:MAG: hypothetical protein HN712_00795 [Gemmatimonadetes bacterium]|jgi:hypothetical protein|nr:hypothetical protein [Gemmatimonadota bacterium]
MNLSKAKGKQRRSSSRLNRPQPRLTFGAAVAALSLFAACGLGSDAGTAAALGDCPTGGEPEALGRIEDGRITECSGLAWSRTQPILWLHNDSGDRARFYGVSADGRLLAVVSLSGAQARDWEDMARGPHPDGGDALFLADIGDNARSRSFVRIYRVREPTVEITDDPGTAPVDISIDTYDTFDLTYPDGPHNAETFLVDPATGDVYIVTKEASGVSTVFYAAEPAHGDRLELIPVATLRIGWQTLPGSGLITAGDVAPDGSEVIIRTYDRVLVYRRPPNSPLSASFATEPCRVPLGPELQGEAVAFLPDGRGYVTVSEGRQPVIYLTQYTEP